MSKITELIDLPSVSTDDIIPIVDSPASSAVTKKVTFANLKTSLALVKGDVGLGSVDNTSDAGKPVSTAQQTALNLKANLASPTFTGTVTLPNATVTLAQQADMATSSLVYRKTAGSGVPEVNTLATLKTDLGLTGTNSGDVANTEVTTNKDASGGYAGLTLLKINFKNAANTFISFFTNTNTAARTYTFQDRDGTIADNTDLALKAPLASPTFTGTVVLPASQSLTTPVIGAATGTSLAVTGAVTSSGGGVGYATGAGGTVTQSPNRTSSVTLNKLCGNITMASAAQASQALVTFTFTNSFIAAGNYLLVCHISATNGGAWTFSTVCSAGSATINIRNVTAASITEATPLRFTIIKGVTA